MDLCELFQQKKCVLSFEVFPPKKSSGVESIYRTLDELCALRPDFISVTFGAGGTGVKDNLTVELAGAIRARGVEPLAHLTCINSDEETLLGLLDRLEEAGVRNILALRGDRVEGAEEGPYRHANELMERIARRGGFNLVGACYPECHCEAPDALHDLQNLRRKQEAGATHLITQLFFDNRCFYDFVEKARIAGVCLPIEAGIMPIVNKRQIERIVTLCGASIPPKFARMLSRFEGDPAALRDAGIAYATEQIIDLIGSGVEGIHIYTLNNPAVARRICENIATALDCVNGGGAA